MNPVEFIPIDWVSSEKISNISLIKYSFLLIFLIFKIKRKSLNYKSNTRHKRCTLNFSFPLFKNFTFFFVDNH